MPRSPHGPSISRTTTATRRRRKTRCKLTATRARRRARRSSTSRRTTRSSITPIRSPPPRRGRSGAARVVARHRAGLARLRAAGTRGAQAHAARRVVRRPALEPVSRADEARMARRCIARALSGGADRRVPGHRSAAVRDLQIACSRRAGPLFFVGDPKQAIYSFRDADLHTYLAARAYGVGALHARREPALDGADHRCLQPRLQRESGGLHAGRTRLPAGARGHATARAVRRQHARCGVFRYRRLLRVDAAAWRIGALEVGRAAGRGRSVRRRNRAAAARCAAR